MILVAVDRFERVDCKERPFATFQLPIEYPLPIHDRFAADRIVSSRYERRLAACDFKIRRRHEVLHNVVVHLLNDFNRSEDLSLLLRSEFLFFESLFVSRSYGRHVDRIVGVGVAGYSSSGCEVAQEFFDDALRNSAEKRVGTSFHASLSLPTFSMKF